MPTMPGVERERGVRRRFFLLAPGRPVRRAWRPWPSVLALVLAGCLAVSMPAWAATYRFEVSLEPGQTGAYTLTHSVQIPIGDPDRGGMHGEVQLRHEAG